MYVMIGSVRDFTTMINSMKTNGTSEKRPIVIWIIVSFPDLGVLTERILRILAMDNFLEILHCGMS